ncbi:hypothetical protein JCM11491_004229 [Sporobolomyces phaffii]
MLTWVAPTKWVICYPDPTHPDYEAKILVQGPWNLAVPYSLNKDLFREILMPLQRFNYEGLHLLPCAPIFGMLRMKLASETKVWTSKYKALLQMAIFFTALKYGVSDHGPSLSEVFLHTGQGWANVVQRFPDDRDLGLAAFKVNYEWCTHQVDNGLLESAATYWVADKNSEGGRIVFLHLVEMVDDLKKVLKETKEILDRAKPCQGTSSPGHHHGRDVFSPAGRR